MRCPNCQADVPEGAAFCGFCGAPLPEETPSAPEPEATPEPAAAPEPEPEPAAAPEPAPELEPGPLPAPKAAAPAPIPAPPAPTVPIPAPTQPLPVAPVAAAGPAPQAAYPPAGYAQQPAQTGYPSAGVPQPPAKKRKTGLIIAIIAVVLLLLCACVVAGLLRFVPVFQDIELISDEPAETVTPPVVTPPADTGTGTAAPDTGTSAPVGYPTPDEAAAAALAAEGLGDWVYQVYEETDTSVVYWAGPPASEWVTGITVDKAADGSWGPAVLTELDLGGGDVSEGELTPYDQAVAVVGDFLYAVKEDRGLDAQALTVDPFHADSASAQMAAGMLDSFEVVEVVEQSDGTFWVKTTQNWDWGVEQWQYWVVPTELGYFIADLQPW